MLKSKKVYYFEVFFATIVWGAAYPFTKHVVIIFPIVLLVFVRAFISSILFYIYYKPNIRKLFSFNFFLKILLMSILGVTLQQYTQAYALKLTPSTNAGFLIALTPIVVVLIEVLLGSKVSFNKFIGFFLGAFGSLIISYSTGRLSFSTPSTIGDIIFITSSFTWAFYVILTKRWFKNNSQIEITALTMFVSVFCMFPFILKYNIVYEFSKLDMLGWFSIVYLCFLSSFLGYMFWNRSVEKLGPVITSYFIYDEPFATIISAYFVLSEKASWLTLYGGALILGGVYFILKEKKVEYEGKVLF